MTGVDTRKSQSAPCGTGFESQHLHQVLNSCGFEHIAMLHANIVPYRGFDSLMDYLFLIRLHQPYCGVRIDSDLHIMSRLVYASRMAISIPSMELMVTSIWLKAYYRRLVSNQSLYIMDKVFKCNAITGRFDSSRFH